MRRLTRCLVVALALLAWDWANLAPLNDHSVAGQVQTVGMPVGTTGSITVSNTAVTLATATGGSATLCPFTGDGVLIYVVNNAIYYTLSTTTPTSSHKAAAAGTYLFVKPWGKINMIRQAADTTLSTECFE